MDANSSPPAAAAPGINAPRINVLRILLLVILTGVAVVFVLDFIARRGHDSAYEKVDKAIEEVEEGKGPRVTSLTDEEVRKLVEQEPDGGQKRRQGFVYERYTWKSPIREFQFYVSYNDTKPPRVKELSSKPLAEGLWD